MIDVRVLREMIQPYMHAHIDMMDAMAADFRHRLGVTEDICNSLYHEELYEYLFDKLTDSQGSYRYSQNAAIRCVEIWMAFNLLSRLEKCDA